MFLDGVVLLYLLLLHSGCKWIAREIFPIQARACVLQFCAWAARGYAQCAADSTDRVNRLDDDEFAQLDAQNCLRRAAGMDAKRWATPIAACFAALTSIGKKGRESGRKGTTE